MLPVIPGMLPVFLRCLGVAGRTITLQKTDKLSLGARCVGVASLYTICGCSFLLTHLTLILHLPAPQLIKYVAFETRTCHKCSTLHLLSPSADVVEAVPKWLKYIDT